MTNNRRKSMHAAIVALLFSFIMGFAQRAMAQEAYAEEKEGTLTFYYDTHKGGHTGQIHDRNIYGNGLGRSW